MNQMNIQIRFAKNQDVPVILDLIRQLAEFEKLSHVVVATEQQLQKTLFGPGKFAEVLLLEEHLNGSAQTVGFALFLHNYSTFLAKPGIYLEDLFVIPAKRGKGYGKLLLQRLAALAVERECGRLEWSVLDWNRDAIRFYESLGAKPLSEWTTFRVDGDALKSLSQKQG